MSVSIDKIVNVEVSLTAPVVSATDFTLGLIIDDTAGDLEGVYDVINRDNYVTKLASYGYDNSSMLYKKVTAYFSQVNSPNNVAIAGVNVSASPAENPSAAFSRIRKEHKDFYGFCYSSASGNYSSSVALGIAAVAETTMKAPCIYFYCSVDDSDIAALNNNVYKRVVGVCSNALTADAAMLGLVSGLCSMRPNSAFTVAYKQLVGIVPEDISDTDLDNILAANGNVFCKFGNSYSFVYPGITTYGWHIDELFLMDAAKDLIQKYVVNGLVSTRKIPQTEDGVNSIVSMISDACNVLNVAGFIAGGIWKSNSVGDLNTGDAIENGFYIYAGSVADQSQADREDRKSPPIYVALLASGAIEYVVINVYINR